MNMEDGGDPKQRPDAGVQETNQKAASAADADMNNLRSANDDCGKRPQQIMESPPDVCAQASVENLPFGSRADFAEEHHQPMTRSSLEKPLGPDGDSTGGRGNRREQQNLASSGPYQGATPSALRSTSTGLPWRAYA